MSAQRTNQCRVWQIWQRVPACQVWSRNVLLEGLAQVGEFFHIREAAVEDGGKVVIGATAVEQVTHVGEVALKQAQWHINGHSLLSKCQISLGSVRCAHECFVCQVAQILHGVNQFCKPSGIDDVLGEMIPQVGFILRQIRLACESVGIQQVRMERRQRGSHFLLQVAAYHIMQANRTRR